MGDICKLRKKFVIFSLRKTSLWWPERTKAKGAARIERGKYGCAFCKKVFGQKEIQLDHIVPVVPYTGWKGFTSYINRLFCSAEGFQVLCRPCHAEKTNKEKQKRCKKRSK